MDLPLTAMQGDACYVDKAFIGKQFDHVLLMGPMYHLQEETQRKQALTAALHLLKIDGLLYISYIHCFASFVYFMKFLPEGVSMKESESYINAFLKNDSFTGLGFTEAYNAMPRDALQFLDAFPLKKMHFFGQEGIMSPGEPLIMQAEQTVIDDWLTISEQVCEREDLLAFSEHFMYIGRKDGAIK